MIDIHHHCLPGVDDGPREMSEAVEMCALAAEEGIEDVIATPHVLRGRWKTFSPPELAARVEELRERTGGRPRLHLGSEYFFAHDMADELRAGRAIVPLAGSRYVLVELVANSVPAMIDRPFYASQLDGWTPILAHPERNTVLQEHPDLLETLVQHGVRVQLTASSLTGAFGSRARRAAETFLRRSLVHFVATDAHGATKRPPACRKEAAALESLVGAAVAEALLVRNPQAVLDKRPLPYDPDPRPDSSPGLFTRLKSFFQIRQA
jgi:protein-tyrosine phosphatase